MLLILLIVPPFIGIGRYKSRITEAISQSFGRPVQLSSVELRLLPWPGFVLTNLTVADDPAYGAEPVLHANTVTARIRLLPLWRGRLEIGSVSVDEASLNVVRAAPGKWNLDPLFRTAASRAGTGGGRARRFPGLEATNSRINFKNGAEKLPFSLVDTDLSFWQESPVEWRLRLRGQPARTDVVLDLADTGIVRMEAGVHRAPELRLMPLTVDLDWRQAQLGQLSRLLIGYDPGWRGDLTGELHLEGTPDAAQVSTQLRAAGVRRAEFLPTSPLDFDANCTFLYRYSQRALDNLACSSPLGDGRLQLTGDVPGNAVPDLTLALDRIPAAAGLDVLRTVRSGIDPDLEAAGAIDGKLTYSASSGAQPTRRVGSAKTRRGRAKAPPQGPLSGSLVVEGLALSGGGLRQPLRVPKVVLEPAEIGAGLKRSGSRGPEMLAGAVSIPAGAPAPLAVSLKLALYGYEMEIRGQASVARARELAQLAGPRGAALLNGLAGEPLTANLTAAGPWVAGQAVQPGAAPPPASNPPADLAGSKAGPAPGFDRGAAPASDGISGTIALHNANWRADYLASHLQISEATLHLGGGALRWDPVAFTYGPVKGTASVTIPASCAVVETPPPAEPCRPRFTVQFGALEAGTLEAAFLGAREKGTLFSDLIARLQSSSAPLWPALEGAVAADSFAIGPVTLAKASATVKIEGDHADLTDIAGKIMGATAKASGTVSWESGGQNVPAYTVAAEFEKLPATVVGQWLAVRWTGGPIALDGKVDLAGFTGKDLAASAKGALHFDWKHGGMAGAFAAATQKISAASALPARFDDWSGNAAIANGAITLGQNQMTSAGRKRAIEGGVTFGAPPKVKLSPAKAQSREMAKQK